MILDKLPSKVKKIITVLCALSPRHKVILEARYCKRMTQDEVARLLKLTSERVRQLEEEAIEIIIKEI